MAPDGREWRYELSSTGSGPLAACPGAIPAIRKTSLVAMEHLPNWMDYRPTSERD